MPGDIAASTINRLKELFSHGNAREHDVCLWGQVANEARVSVEGDRTIPRIRNLYHARGCCDGPSEGLP